MPFQHGEESKVALGLGVMTKILPLVRVKEKSNLNPCGSIYIMMIWLET